jgi:adiponectin receptor
MALDIEHGYALPGDGWARKRINLITIDELPSWYEPLSPFVRTGYRPPGMPFCVCAATVCEKHNETGNIWTHLIGGAVWIAVCLHALMAPDLYLRSDEFTFRLHMTCYILCGLMPFASTCAHLYHCQNQTWYVLCWDMDHVGILALWYARALCEGYVLLFCSDLWNSWAILTTLVFVVSTYEVVRSHGTVLFLPLYAFIHIPIVYVATFEDAFWAPESSTHFPLGEALRNSVAATLIGSLCGVVGYAIMVTKVPESILPGRFDYWFHSHQWWHILTAVGPVLCMEAGRDMLAARLDFTCDAGVMISEESGHLLAALKM